MTRYHEDFDPPTDESTRLVCPNPDCDNGEVWSPRTFSEYQGEVPHGGMVTYHDEDDLYCEFCGAEAVDQTQFDRTGDE